MILGVPNPVENVPSLVLSMANAQKAQSYRNQVECNVVLYCMLFWLENETIKRSVWKDISAMYWKHNGNEVLDSVKQRARSNKALRAYDKDNQGRNGVDLVARLEKRLGSSKSWHW